MAAPTAESDAKLVESKILVHRTVKLDGSEDSASESEVIEVTKFLTTPAIVSVSVPVKIVRNFQSIGLEVTVQLPCYKEEIDRGIELAYRIAKDRVFREIPAIQQSLTGVADSTSTAPG